jgi:tetratricopeptide (TPR) repeat protein
VNGYLKSLEIDPFMWCAFEKLCKLNPSKVDPMKKFSELNPLVLSYNQKSKTSSKVPHDFTLSPEVNLHSNRIVSTNRPPSKFVLFNNSNNSQIPEEDNDDMEIVHNNITPNVTNVTPVIKKEHQNYLNMKKNNKPFNFSSSPSGTYEFNSLDSGDNSRLGKIRPFDINKSVNSSYAETTPKNFTGIFEDQENRNHLNMFLNKNDNAKFEDISQLLKKYGEIMKLLSTYNCDDCINLTRTLPSVHQRSGYILSILGRCYFELAKYKESERYYKECIKIEPARLEGFEYYSSCLWHLKEQYQLCTIANHALEVSQYAPETWIVVGNCYSLQKEHEIALKFFNRAIQLNNSFAYAYTLCGHEYVDNENYTQAKNCYTQAIQHDER